MRPWVFGTGRAASGEDRARISAGARSGCGGSFRTAATSLARFGAELAHPDVRTGGGRPAYFEARREAPEIKRGPTAAQTIEGGETTIAKIARAQSRSGPARAL